MENDSLGVWVTVCEDERSQMVLELIRECETLQAIDRIRLMRGDKIKQVYVMCNIPLDITVNKVVSLKDFCTEVGGEKYAVFAKAMEQRTDGVLPINPSYLSTEYDDVFGSTKDVNNLLSGAGLVGKLDTLKIGLNSDFYYILLNRNWNLIEFTAHGKSKKHYKAITSKSISPWITRHLLSKIFETNITVHDHLFEPRTLMNCKVKICNDDIDILKFKIATFEEYSDYINNAA